MKGRDDSGPSSEEAIASHSRKKSMKCHHCGKLGHIKRNCRLLSSEEQNSTSHRHGKERANKATASGSDGETESADALVVCHALAVSATIATG